MPRISRDEMFMRIAEVVALRGTCDRARVGAILVTHKNNIEAVGYNGAPSGEPHCDDVGHLMENGHCVRTIHAEYNCCLKVLTAPWDKSKRYTMFVTHFPCRNCTEEILHFSHCLTLERIVYKNAYGDEDEIKNNMDLLKARGIKVERYTI